MSSPRLVSTSRSAVGGSSSLSPPLALTLDHVSPVTRLLEKRKEMLSVQEELDGQKEEYASREELFKRREENLRRKDLELQEALVLFNKFLKENEAKRRRADHRANEEIKKRLKWEKDIAVRRSQLDKLKEKNDKLKGLVREHERYQSYLQSVFDENGQHFDEIHSIIARYQTLKATNQDLIKRQTALLAENEKERSAYSLYKKDQFNKNLSSNNEIAIYSRELEEAVKRTSEIEEALIQEEKEEALRKRQTSQIVLATDNLYQRCRRALAGIRKHANVQKLKLPQHNNPSHIGGSSGSASSGGSASGSASALAAPGKDAVSEVHVAVQAETMAKLDEIAQYLTDFADIVSSISGVAIMGKTAATSERVPNHMEESDEED